MLKKQLSVAIPEELNGAIQRYLLKVDGEEEILFALWVPSEGSDRLSALINSPIYPKAGDRQRHRNVSFNARYFERVCELAAAHEGYGIALLHSHLGPGWQDLSGPDIKAELKIAGAVAAVTDLPLFGLTLGTDGVWSARVWDHEQGKSFKRLWCGTVRSVGIGLHMSFADCVISRPQYRELFKRTQTVWGTANHLSLSRTHIGIVGLGSVGSMVAETLARMGLTRFTLIDFDEVQPHNLDRLLGATEDDIGKLKVDVAGRQIRQSATASKIEVRSVPFSIAEEEGYRAALDCDVLFSCVDRPRARSILNHFAYGHLIPVVDGGIEVRFKNGEFSGVDWQLQTVAPGRPCLKCLKIYNSGDVSTEIEGKLDDSSYLKGLSKDHRFRRNENVFPFSANLASLEVLQFVELATGIGGLSNIGIQRFRYIPGTLEIDSERICTTNCEFVELTGQGDLHFRLCGRDLTAEAARVRQGR